ncbi:MAG TPA: hypothetical protein VFP72_12515 [Kineosporiaceae bacterium]|nr:hypothetical protein [Kineosporiaceae bacterium]
MTTRLVRHDTDTPVLSGPAANERLTGWAGGAIFVLLAAEGVTVLLMHELLVPHVVIGLLLIGPVLLKLASTGYRFLRYYTGDPMFRVAGPPMIVLRVLAPLLVVATVLLLGTGSWLLYAPPALRDVVVFLHKASFAIWFLLTAAHVLAYVWRVPKLLGADLRPGSGAPSRRGAGARLAALTLSIAAGALLAAQLAQRAEPWIQILRQHHER